VPRAKVRDVSEPVPCSGTRNQRNRRIARVWISSKGHRENAGTVPPCGRQGRPHGRGVFGTPFMIRPSTRVLFVDLAKGESPSSS